ncbi:hypothetical protein K431DRAFT_96161 [Polychaeton citri CBS 116435]|uniref:Secreted protein n=1 Tax=Polychaeton citri CBS 116435 TaxID=1314669 RepID=A0A9P4ULI9_9PEZI|nr:hypothetical protein K431DRAFT_96161 [Polychaeton citri CBS 116435]
MLVVVVVVVVVTVMMLRHHAWRDPSRSGSDPQYITRTSSPSLPPTRDPLSSFCRSVTVVRLTCLGQWDDHVCVRCACREQQRPSWILHACRSHADACVGAALAVRNVCGVCGGLPSLFLPLFLQTVHKMHKRLLRLHACVRECVRPHACVRECVRVRSVPAAATAPAAVRLFLFSIALFPLADLRGRMRWRWGPIQQGGHP